MESAEHELEERRERLASLEKALDDTRVVNEQRERELSVQVKDYRYLYMYSNFCFFMNVCLFVSSSFNNSKVIASML